MVDMGFEPGGQDPEPVDLISVLGKASGGSSALWHLQKGGGGGGGKCGFKSSPLKALSVLPLPCRKAEMRTTDTGAVNLWRNWNCLMLPMGG